MRSTVLLLLLVACATGGPNEQPMREDRVSLHDSEGQIFDVSLQRQDYVQQSTFDVPGDSLWVRIPDALRDVGLPLPVMDAAIRTALVENHTVMRTLGTERLSRFLDCGSDITGYVADTHRIRLTVRSWLEPEGRNTRLHTRVEATATSVEGRPGRITCSSRGELEYRIAQALRARVSQ